MLWNGNESRHNEGNEIPKTTKDYDRSKETENYGIFQTFGLLGAKFTCEMESRISGKSRIQQEQGYFCLQILT
jgi:hypothetical protein